METNPLLWDLIDLACQLRQERLFVESEKSQLVKLNQEVVCASSKLSQLAWVTAQQRRNLNRLVLSCPDATPSVSCRRATSLHSTQFIDANKIFSFQELVGYGELMSALRDSPVLLSHCLVAGDRLLPDEMPGIVHSLVSGLFTNCLLPQDKTSILRLLSHLITLQLLPSETPRRMLKNGSCAFARLYSEFHEGHFAAKLFLTAALHLPIMKLLMLEEKYMDIDPEKAIMRLSQEERTKRFGVEGTDSYKEELKKHQEWAVSTLVSITKVFITSLHDNLHCFPSSIWWLVGQIYARLNNNNNVPEKEVFAMCTDLVVTMFLCPAIVTPEPYGIIDAPISPVARFNLMQVAHVLQTLAMYKYQPIDPRHAELYSNFETDCVSSIIDSILESNVVCDEPPLVDNNKLEGISRNAALFTQNQLNSLVSFLRTVANEVSSEDEKTKKELLMLLDQIPMETTNGHNNNNNGNSTKAHVSPERQSSSRKASNILAKVTKQPKNNFAPENGGIDDDDLLIEKVLVIPFDMNNPDSTIGMLSEQKIIEMEKVGELEKNEQASIMAGERMEGQEKRTRFSLSHDDGSIGNTSDNLEVVSEAPSNHSVASSLELETEDQNDNLSDMVSANVSGRGSPNISGRDTPSSQMTEGEDVGGREGSLASASVSRQHLEFSPRVMPPPTKATSRFDLDDKFGKFEIKTLIEGGDETVSLVSDTWSTDVLASDSETVEATQSEPVPPCLSSDPIANVQLIELSETASEAWSTDVVASDSERMTEIDTDDTASVARSDDTGRSEPDGREEQDPVDEHGQSVGLRSSLCEVRGSPTRSETARRRTLEFISNNRNSAFIKNTSAGGSASDGGGDRLRMPPPPPFSMDSPLLTSSPALSCHHRISFRSASQPSSAPEGCEDLEVGRGVGESAGGSGFSTASIASSSSSASSSEPRHNNISESRINPLLTPNGSVVNESSSKPSPSGAVIPKSISFDKTAERGDKESHDEESKHKKGFFKSFKLSFRNRRGKNFRSTENYEHIGSAEIEGIPSIRIRRGLSEEMRPYRNVSEMSEDILAKYRRKSPGSSGEPAEVKVKSSTTQEQPPPMYPSFPFDDAKKKLRLVLSNAEFQQIPDVLPAMRNAWMQKENELVAFLQLQLAEAINLQDRNLIPQLHETLRCVRTFSERESRSVVESLKEDYKIRSPYISYLVKCRQSLLQTLSHLERLNDQVKSDGQAVLEFLTSVCVRFFIERREPQLNKFISEFQALKLADEKCDLIESFLQQLFCEIDRDPLWHYASDEQLSHAQVTIERFLYSKVYFHAMYPNGDGDISRDQVLHDHMNKLSKDITPSHKDLRIPKEYHCECPWLSAQAELTQIGAFRTPRDKLHCALRAIYTINKLLSLSCMPAADDLTPVLVYVLIMANPPSLLSTVEYVTTFYGSRLVGEEHYYWTQFCAAIEFIKTMDYTL